MKKRAGILEYLLRVNENHIEKARIINLLEEASEFFRKMDMFYCNQTNYNKVFALLSDSKKYYTYEKIMDETFINEKVLKRFNADLNKFISKLLKEKGLKL